jgi:hypothetical protein
VKAAIQNSVIVDKHKQQNGNAACCEKLAFDVQNAVVVLSVVAESKHWRLA